MTNSFGKETFRALDLEKFICRFERNLKFAKSLRRLGMVVIGSVRNSRISSTYAATLNCLLSISNPLMVGFPLSLWRKGSKVRMKIKGDRGHPCLVPLDTEKASDR